MIKIFETLLDDGNWGKRAFNLDHVIGAMPKDNSSITIFNLLGEFIVKGTLEDLVHNNYLEVFKNLCL